MRRPGLIVLLGALTAFGPMSIDMYLPAFPVLTRHFHASPAQVQLTLTACLAGLALGQLGYGPMSDALGRRKPLYGGLVAYVVASGLCVVAPSIGVLVGLRFVQGLGGAAGIVIARAMVRDMYDGTAAARFFSMLMVVNGLAPILAPLLGSQIMRYGSWTGVFAVLTGYGLVLLGTAYRLPETLPPQRRRSGRLGDTLATFGRLSRDRAFIGYAVCGGLVFAAMFAYIAGSPFVLQEIYHVSPQSFALAFGANALGIVLFGQLNSVLLRRFGARVLLSVLLCVHLAGALGVLAAVASGSHHLYWLLPPLFLTVASVGVVLPNTTALALSGHADAAGSASAVLGVGQFLFGALAAPLVGLGGGGTALPMAVLILALSVAANVALRTLARTPVPVPFPT